MKNKGSFIAGMICGALLFGGSAAYAAGMIAEPSTHQVSVDGKNVELEAYVIDGSNYVRLRDVGETVGFNVWWDEEKRTVQIESDRPYTGVASAGKAIEYNAGEIVEYTEAVNPAVLTGAYTREAYEALRSAILTGAGSASAAMSQETRAAIIEAGAAISCWPTYDLKSEGSGVYSFTARYPESYAEAAIYCQAFVDSLEGEPDQEKVRQLAFFVCDRIEYDGSVYCSPRTALVSDEVQKGACMSYALNFKFLCDLSGIPCIFTHSENHQWNQVYVDGRWWHVDVTSADVSDTSWRSYLPVLKEESEMQGSIYVQSQPRLTDLAKELLVPGSTMV